MVGRKIDLNIQRPVVEKTRPLLEIRDLTIRNDEGAVAIDHVNFYIRGGEILGVAGLRPEGAVRGHRRAAPRPVRPDDPQGGQHRGALPQGHSGKGHLHVLYPGGPAGHGPGPLPVHHGQHDPEKLRPGQGPLCGPKGRPGGCGTRHSGAGGGHPIHRDTGAPPVRRQRAEGAAGPGDQGRDQRHRHRLSRAGAGHQLLLCHLSHPEPAEAERRGHPVRGRGPGRDAGIVRQDHGAVPRKGHGRGPRPQDHQGGAWPDDDRGAGPVKPL